MFCADYSFSTVSFLKINKTFTFVWNFCGTMLNKEEYSGLSGQIGKLSNESSFEKFTVNSAAGWSICGNFLDFFLYLEDLKASKTAILGFYTFWLNNYYKIQIHQTWRICGKNMKKKNVKINFHS